ncbi:hypothetical protein [Streptomyces sp. NPDC057413]|uniref:hypothetical protein n=1 Tax=Streptomyces sp. NPDC057413 TaxID=3346124 RepID=UPI00368C99FE
MRDRRRPGRGRWRHGGHRPAVFAALVTAVVAVTLFAVSQQDGRAAPSYFFGTLQTGLGTARQERDKGIGVAHLPIYWDRVEPVRGHIDTGYVAGVKDALRTFQDAGMKVEAGLGLNHPPGWVLDRHPGNSYTDQNGREYTDSPNLAFSQELRNEAQGYLRWLDRDIGLRTFWAIRIGVNDTGEYAYPPPGDGERTAFWAFDRHAQASGRDPGRPATVPANPYPDWRPGQQTYRGEPFTPQQADRWYAWYLGALADTVNWQIRQFDALHYPGILKVLIPGGGLQPRDLSAALSVRLAPTAQGGLVGRGSAYFRTIPMILHHGNVQLVSTALVDGSGTPRNNVCRPQDAAVDVRALATGSGPADLVGTWSSVRWVARIAAETGFTVSGESAGPEVESYYPGVMNDAARQMTTCGLKGLMWAFDRNLYDGTPGSSLEDYAAVIARLDKGSTP